MFSSVEAKLVLSFEWDEWPLASAFIREARLVSGRFQAGLSSDMSRKALNKCSKAFATMHVYKRTEIELARKTTHAQLLGKGRKPLPSVDSISCADIQCMKTSCPHMKPPIEFRGLGLANTVALRNKHNTRNMWVIRNIRKHAMQPMSLQHYTLPAKLSKQLPPPEPYITTEPAVVYK